MRPFNFLLALLFLFCNPTQSNATHIVGGEMSYRYFGNDQYEITMKIYRDCLNGTVYFDSPAPIGIFNAQTNALISTCNAYPNSDDTLSLGIVASCYSGCLHTAVYHCVITLPPTTSGYVIAYQRCCRNNGTINVSNPGGYGMTVFIEITPSALLKHNNSPKFINNAPVVLAAYDTLALNLSATDIDGDSLAYTFYTPFDGASSTNSAPNPPLSPPYYPLPYYYTPYSGQTPILGSPQITYNATTGILSGVPYILGTYIVGLCILEYDATGTLLSRTYRDIMIAIRPCASTIPIINLPNTAFSPSIFPNPSADIFTVQCEHPSEISMQIFSQYGTKIHEQSFNNQTDINLSNYPMGVYFVELTVGKERVVKKIIKL